MGIHEDIVDQRVEGIAKEYADVLGDEPSRRRARAFVALGVAATLDLDVETAIRHVRDGEHDAGIDALRWEEVGNRELVVWIFQGKYHAKRDGSRGFPANELVKLVGTLRALFDPTATFSAHERLLEDVEEVRSLIRDGWLPSARVVALSNGRRWEHDGDLAVDPASTGFGDQVSWEHLGAAEIVERLSGSKPVDDQLQFVGPAVVDDGFSFRRVVLGRVPVAEIARLVSAHGDRLFERNVRRFLGPQNRVNRDISRTLADPGQRGDFFFLNNGLTVLCTKFRHNAIQQRDLTVRAEGLQIVNGQQTASTIRRLVDRLASEDWSSASVLVRLYELEQEDPDFTARVTYATNSQNPVDLRDLRANDEIQRRLELGMRDLGFVYARHRGIHPRGAVTPEEAAEAILAVLKERPLEAQSRRNEHFGKLYGEIFTDDLVPAQVCAAVSLLRLFDPRTFDADPDQELVRRRFSYGRHLLAWLVGRELEVAKVSHLTLAAWLEGITKPTPALVEAARRGGSEYTLASTLCGVLQDDPLQDHAAVARRGELVNVLRDLRSRTQKFLAPYRARHAEVAALLDREPIEESEKKQLLAYFATLDRQLFAVLAHTEDLFPDLVFDPVRPSPTT